MEDSVISLEDLGDICFPGSILRNRIADVIGNVRLMLRDALLYFILVGRH